VQAARREPPIAVAGMHRSGTSMVAHALKLADVYLGADRDLYAPTHENPDGYWEHTGFVGLNNEILARLGGGWERPPAVPARFGDDDRLSGLEAEATRLVAEFHGHDGWAWKDPRNSLTIGLWREVVPGLAVVVCVRNPLEVMLSLRRRGMFSYAVALDLWETYYRRLLEATPADRRLVTDYESYFSRPRAELRRLFGFAGVTASHSRLNRAAAAINPHHRHSVFTVRDLFEAEVAPEIVELYLELRREAGLRDSSRARPAPAPKQEPRHGGPAVDVSRLETIELRQYASALESIVAVRELELKYARDQFDSDQRSWEMEKTRLQERLRTERRELAKRSRELQRLVASRADVVSALESLRSSVDGLRDAVGKPAEEDEGEAADPAERAARLRSSGPGRALVCSYGPPPYDRDSGARRLWHLIGFLREAGWDVTFLASSKVKEDHYVEDLLQLGIPVHDGSEVSAKDMIAGGRFDLALCAFWQVAELYLPVLREVSPQTAVIVDSVDLHFVSEARRAFARRLGLLGDTFGAETAAELNVYAAADAVLAVSPQEAALLGGLLCDREASFWVPDAEDLAESRVKLRDRAGIVFVGSFRHLPNVDALDFFSSDIVPLLDGDLLERHPISVVGDGLDERAPAAARRTRGLHLVGWTPALEPYIERARVSVVPLRYGAGTKRKVLQSLLLGTPVVTTSVGAEGLNVRSEEHVLVADDPATFAEATTRLLEDDALWRRLSVAGRKQVASDHSSDAVQKRLFAAVESALSRSRKPPTLEAGGRRLYEYRTRVQDYEKIVPPLRDSLRDLEPVDGTVLVFSEGVGELLQLGERRARHFPPLEVDGAGARPSQAGAAIALDLLHNEIGEGAAFLVVPKWIHGRLDSYSDVLEYLRSCEAQELAGCAVYRLAGSAKQVPGAAEPSAAAESGGEETSSLALVEVVV
jgi:glycosyltransferase involved in cell wall biosynthesis